MGSSGGGDDDDTRQLDSAGRLMDGYPNLCINVHGAIHTAMVTTHSQHLSLAAATV